MKHYVVDYRSGQGDVSVAVAAIGEGPRIVLLPSLGRDVEDFFPVARLLADRGKRALMPSPRGLGGSRGPLVGNSLVDLARDVAEVIRQDATVGRDGAEAKANNGTGVLVAGHAFGNWIARMTATRHPELVRGVALLAAAQRDFPRRLRDTIDRIMDATRPESARLADLQDAFFAPGHDARAWLEGWHPQVAHAQREAARASPAQAWWSAGGVPLLDVQADNDPFAPRSGAHLLQEELGPRVSIALIEDAGHALLPEQPAAVADVLAAFSAKLDANPYANP